VKKNHSREEKVILYVARNPKFALFCLLSLSYFGTTSYQAFLSSRLWFFVLDNSSIITNLVSHICPVITCCLN
jgi:hypothetical protein